MIEFAPKAVTDLERLYAFLAPKNPDAAARAMKAIWRKLELLERMPGIGHRTKSPFVRETKVFFGKDGYIVQYTVREDAALLVLRIWHGREDRK